MKKSVNWVDTLTLAVKASGKWGLYISFDPNEDFSEISKAAPWLTIEEDMEVILEGKGLFLFDTEEEMWACYDQTIGDDVKKTDRSLFESDTGVTVYALTLNPDGSLGTENT